jgi:hypothetical protein
MHLAIKRVKAKRPESYRDLSGHRRKFKMTDSAELGDLYSVPDTDE